MSCNSLNQSPQRYRLTYPEKNTVFYSNTPTKQIQQDAGTKCKILQYTPSTCNQCSSTFIQPWNQNPNDCLKMCKGIDTYKMDACSYENNLYKTKLPGAGCIMERSLQNYTNTPMIEPVIIAPGCQKTEVYRPPFPPQYGQKGSSAYNPVQYEFGAPYVY